MKIRKINTDYIWRHQRDGKCYLLYEMWQCGRRHLILLLSIVLGVQKGWIHFIQCHIMPCYCGFGGNRQIRICAFFIPYKGGRRL